MTQADFALLHRWLNEPHMREFYQKEPISLECVEEKYGGRARGEVPVLCHIALIDGKPAGKFQCYRVMSHPDYAEELGVGEGISIDLFLGEPAFLGKGFGSELLKKYCELAFEAYPEESKIYICHEQANVAALACSKAAGFRDAGEVIEAGARCELLVRERGQELTE